MAKKKIDLSLIIPCFNEQKRLPKRFTNSYKFLFTHFKNLEIIFVNDGSTDNTEKMLQTLVSKFKNTKLITYSKNHGKGYAIKQGVAIAQGEIIGFTDADFAVDLIGVTAAFKSIKNGADIVIGDRNASDSKLINKPNVKRRIFG